MKIVTMEVLKKLRNIFLSKDPWFLVVEDTASAAERIKERILEFAPNATVHVPTSYTQVKNCLKDGFYDAILLDNSLTGWSDAAGTLGVRTIPFIKDTNPKAFILFISNEERVGEILVQEGMADHHVYKSDFDDLIEKLEKLPNE